jgi:nitrile hydratase accessory protein
VSDERVEALGDELAVPRRNGELLFEAPWEGRVFGMAMALGDGRAFSWDDFRDRLAAELADAQAHGDDSAYYERWLASFERLLLDRGVLTPGELDARTAELAAGVFDEHEHYETTSDAIASLTRSPHTSDVRNVVWRADGEPINVFRRPGQLFVCATGCCCGRTERGHAPVPEELYHREWVRRRIRHRVHLSMGGCLGPCSLSNVALLLFAGRQVWFHSIATEAQVLAIYDYVEAMVRADRYLPPPPELAPQVFDVFDWPGPSECHSEERSDEESRPARWPPAPDARGTAEIPRSARNDTSALTS